MTMANKSLSASCKPVLWWQEWRLASPSSYHVTLTDAREQAQPGYNHRGLTPGNKGGQTLSPHPEE